tara:strand:- start:169 stop:471 length:303 start_codon:yes stop_codon:yes gene_type:complete
VGKKKKKIFLLKFFYAWIARSKITFVPWNMSENDIRLDGDSTSFESSFHFFRKCFITRENYFLHPFKSLSPLLIDQTLKASYDDQDDDLFRFDNESFSSY